MFEKYAERLIITAIFTKYKSHLNQIFIKVNYRFSNQIIHKPGDKICSEK